MRDESQFKYLLNLNLDILWNLVDVKFIEGASLHVRACFDQSFEVLDLRPLVYHFLLQNFDKRLINIASNLFPRQLREVKWFFVFLHQRLRLLNNFVTFNFTRLVLFLESVDLIPDPLGFSLKRVRNLWTLKIVLIGVLNRFRVLPGGHLVKSNVRVIKVALSLFFGDWYFLGFFRVWGVAGDERALSSFLLVQFSLFGAVVLYDEIIERGRLTASFLAESLLNLIYIESVQFALDILVIDFVCLLLFLIVCICRLLDIFFFTLFKVQIPIISR